MDHWILFNFKSIRVKIFFIFYLFFFFIFFFSFCPSCLYSISLRHSFTLEHHCCGISPCWNNNAIGTTMSLSPTIPYHLIDSLSTLHVLAWERLEGLEWFPNQLTHIQRWILVLLELDNPSLNDPLTS